VTFKVDSVAHHQESSYCQQEDLVNVTVFLRPTITILNHTTHQNVL